MVDQVEIMKGPFSSLYGSNAMGGVVNIVTPKTRGALKGRANLAYGSYNRFVGSAGVGGTITGGLNFDLNIYGNTRDDYKIGSNNILGVSETEKAILDKNSYGATFPNTSYSQVGGNLRLGYDFNDNWSLSWFTGLVGLNDVMNNGSFWGAYGASKKNINRWNNSLELEGKIGDNHLSFRPYFHNDFEEQFNGVTDTAFVNYDKNFKNFGFQLQDRWTIGNHTLIFGIDNNYEVFKTKRYSDNANEIAPYNPDYQNSATGILAQAMLNFVDDRLNLAVGGRFDKIGFDIEASEYLGNDAAEENHSVFNPNLGLKYLVTQNVNVHTSIGTAFLAPTALQKAGSYQGWYTYEGNPDLKPETSVTYDIGIGWADPDIGIEFDATYFNTQHKDLIIQIAKEGVENTQTYANANKANMHGMELIVAYDFGALADYDFSLKAYANFTLMIDTKMKMDVDGAEEEMRYVREQNGNFGLQFAKDRWSARLNGRFIGHRIENNWFDWYPDIRPDLPPLAGESQPEYWENGLLRHPQAMVFDANVFYDISKNFTAGISAGNLFDENYMEKDGFHMPGRNIMGKVLVNF